MAGFQEQGGSGLKEGIHGADFSIDPESLVQTDTINHASSLHQYYSNLTAAIKGSYRVTLDFFKEVITMLCLCYPDLLMMLMYWFEGGWNYGAICVPAAYFAFLVMLHKKTKVWVISSEAFTGHVDVTSVRQSEMSSSTGTCNINHQSQLQIKVDRLNSKMKKVVMAFSFVIFVVLMFYYYFQGPSATEGGGNNDGHVPKAPKAKKATMAELLREVQRIIKKQGRAANKFIGFSSVVLMSIRGGLPTGVLISLLCSKKKMESTGARILNLAACVTTGCIDTICTSKTGDLTFKKKKMAELWIGQKIVNDFEEVNSQEFHNAVCEGITLNVSGPAEDAQLCLARLGLGVNIEALKDTCTIMGYEAFDDEGHSSCISIRKNGEEGTPMVYKHLKGAPDSVLSMCSNYYDIDGTVKSMDAKQRDSLKQISKRIGVDSLHCLAFAYKEVVEEKESIGNTFTLLSIVGFKNPYPQELIQSVKACRAAGLDIKLVVDDDLNTGRFIAINSGIIQSEENLDKAVIEADEFRNLSDEQRENRVDNIRLMVNSTPPDKLLMVQDLKRRRKTVAVASNSTSESESLEEADVSIFMVNGDPMFPQGSIEIDLSHYKMTTIAYVLRQGRLSFNNIKKYIQLHLTVTLAGSIINFLAAISTGKIFLSQYQIWWVSLIADTFGAFALSTDPPASAPPASPPSHGAISLTTKTIWRNLVFQALYQSTMSLGLHFIAIAIFHVDETEVTAMIINSYALCQLFVLLNAREIEKKNIFENMHKNYWFLVVLVFMVLLQLMFTYFNPRLSLDLLKWCICIVLSALSLPIGWVVKYIPVPAYVWASWIQVG